MLALYGEHHAPTVSDPERIGYAIDGLLRFWAGRSLSEVKGESCRQYVAARGVASSTARRELGTLSAAINWAHREGYITAAVPVTLPAKPPPKDRWLELPEAARLLRRARRTPHMARFVAVGLYTGTRKDRVMRLRWRPHEGGGWVDVRSGLLYRRAEAEMETRKRAPAVRLPGKLLVHLRRWHAADGGDGWVVNWKGARVLSIKTAWRGLVRDAELPGVTPHTLRHTAITWAMQRGADPAHVVGFFGISLEELQRTYWHHHPDHQAGAVAAMNR